MKSIILHGTLGKENSLDYVLLPNSELTTGKWKMCVISLAYNCNQENIEDTCILVSNFSRDHKYSRDINQVISYQQPFALFSVTSGKKNLSFSKFLSLLLILSTSSIPGL